MPYFYKNISVSLLISDVFLPGPPPQKIPEITAAPLTPLPSSLDTFSLLILPIATTGIFTEAAIFLSSSIERFFASFWSYFQNRPCSDVICSGFFGSHCLLHRFGCHSEDLILHPRIARISLSLCQTDRHVHRPHPFPMRFPHCRSLQRDIVPAAEFLKFYCFFSGFFRIQFFFAELKKGCSVLNNFFHIQKEGFHLLSASFCL